MVIGQKIKELRISKGLKQWQLAKLIGCHQAVISNWEKGVCEPTIYYCHLLADYFNISLDELCCRDFKGG